MIMTLCLFSLEYSKYGYKLTFNDYIIVLESLQQIVDLDEKNQILTANVWLDMVWHDASMIWNASFYNNVEVLQEQLFYLSCTK